MNHMNHITDFVHSHKKVCVVASGLVLICIVLSVARCDYVSAQRQANAAQTQPKTSLIDAETSATTSDVAPTAEQKKLIDSYGVAQADFVRGLDAHVWVLPQTGATSSKSIVFDGNTYTVTTDATTSKLRAFAISAVSGPTICEDDKATTTPATASSSAADDASATTASILLDDGKTYLISVRKNSTPATPDVSALTMSTTAFGGSSATTYQSSRAAASVAVEGLDNAELVSAFGSDEDKLSQALEKQVKAMSPSATKATWTQTLVVDYKSHTAQAIWSLNDSHTTSLVVLYHQDTHTFDFKQARS